MRLLHSFVIASLMTADAAYAEQSMQIGHTSPACVRSGEMTVLNANCPNKGALRVYFRKVNTTDWCSVEGNNLGPLSSTTLPKFDDNDQIEYYFLLLNGKQVIAKSPQIYRVSVTSKCDTPFARHVLLLTMDCSERGGGSLPASSGAGYSIKQHTVVPTTPFSRSN